MRLQFSGNFDNGDFECYTKNQVSGKKIILMVQNFNEMNQNHELFSKTFFFYMQKCLEATYQIGIEHAIDQIEWQLLATKQKILNDSL